MRNWATPVDLWNLALNPQGGPVQPPNYGCLHCTGIVTIDPTRHTVQLAATTTSLASSHATSSRAPSGWAPTTSSPTRTSTRRDGSTPRALDDVAFQNPDHSRVLLAFNSARRPVEFAVSDAGYNFRYRLAAGATATFVWKP